jgi:hypothetical protein
VQTRDRESSKQERRDQLIAEWMETIQAWDWVPIQAAVEEEGRFRLGSPKPLMALNWKQLTPQEEWVEVYCFTAALRAVAGEHDLTITREGNFFWVSAA